MAHFPHLIIAVIGLGFLSALGLGSYMLASRYLPFVIFGLLSYLEPVLLAFASIVLGERVETGEWLTYIPIWIAVLLLVIEGTIHIIKQKHKQRALNQNVENYQDRLK
jgi:chloramphenicol-sensitive protein RarD